MEEKKEEQFNLEEIKKKALEQFRSGKSLYGKDGAFAPLLKSFLDAALDEEMDAHLDDEERAEGNRRNGKTRKTVQTNSGPVEIETSRDRSGTFEPELIKKRETVLADTLEIEGFHRQVRKVTKTKGAFPSDMALLKLIYLAYTHIRKKWNNPLQNWSITVSQLSIWFEGRLKLSI